MYLEKTSFKKEDPNGYTIEIGKEVGIIVVGCDCADDMSDETAYLVFFALRDYLIDKNRI